ncbi:MAG: PP2C family protein-serine/threonine phosphatase [Cyclobacteriaceae bacterium]|nr:PP2C family protein-serine/threonine phosphatase [Cyclobacteriaceae bacterium]
MPETFHKNRYEIKELELNALLEVTQAINNNVPEDFLYKIYNFTLRSNLNIKKLALYVLDDLWNCKVNFGTEQSFQKVKLPDCFKDIRTINSLRDFENTPFSIFDIVVPVAHKDRTLALVFLGDHQHDGNYADDSLKFIQALSNIIIVAIENKKLARKQLEQEALRKELEIASDVQQFLFPEKLPDTEFLNVEASYLPHDVIGGDYYDYIPINKNQFLLCIADVSGKGIPAALMMSNFQASLRTLLRQTPNLRDIIEALNFQVLENAKGEKFITFFACIYDISLKTLVYINAGHNPPILCDKKNGMRLLEEGSTVLGAMHPLPFLNEGFITDLEQFRLFCYTDGLTETVNEKGEEFGMDRLMKYFHEDTTRVKDMRTIHNDIIIELDTFKGDNGYHDDITMVSCRVG